MRPRLLALFGTAVGLSLGITARVSAQSALAFTKRPALTFPDGATPTTGGHGAFWADVNGDGRPDLYLTRNERNPDIGDSAPGHPLPGNIPESQAFFLNMPPLEERGASHGIADSRHGAHGAVWADLDNDGDYDLVVGNTYVNTFRQENCVHGPRFYDCANDYAPLSIYRNDGSGHFDDVTPAGVRAERSGTRAVLAFDMEADGDLDLVAINGPFGPDRPPAGFNDLNQVWRNDGNFQFTLLHGSPLRTAALGQSAVAVDVDNDGDVDVVACGGSLRPIQVFRNEGGGAFTPVEGNDVGLVDHAYSGLSAADVDNDGHLDMLVTTSPAPWVDNAVLYLNDGTGTFTRVQQFDHINGLMGGFADLDNDSDVDLVFAGDDRVWLNDGHGRFTPATVLPVPRIEQHDDPDPRSIGFADYDLDGDVDFAVASKVQESYIIRNDTGRIGNFINLTLIGPAGTAGAFGAKVRVYRAGHLGGTLVAYREAQGSYGYLAQDDPVLHIGIGALRAVDIDVELLGGRHRILLDQGANRAILVDGRAIDTNSNQIDDDWERFYFGTLVSGSADPDGDSVTNVGEFLAGTHPNGSTVHRRYLAEGAVGYFETLVAVANAGNGDAHVLLTFQTDDGRLVRWPMVVAAQSMSRVRASGVPGLSSSPGRAFSTSVESDRMVVVDRRMEWGSGTYGLTAERSLPEPRQRWYFAEGFTFPFNLYFLVQNPNVVPATVDVTYLRSDGKAPGHQTYTVAPQSRRSIWVNQEVTIEGFSLAHEAVAAVFASAAPDVPIVVERAMYLDGPGQPLGAGHVSAGVTAPATSWFTAEGHVGEFFDTYLMIGNANEAAAALTVTYLFPNGTPARASHTVPANGKLTIWMDRELETIAGVTESDVSVEVNADVNVVVERTMWWPGAGTGATWYGAHGSPAYPGETGATRWAIADGENSADARAVQTYLLVANVSDVATDVTVTLFFEDGGTAQRVFSGVPANSRLTIPVWRDFPESIGRRFGALMASSQANAIVVERAIYSGAGGLPLAAGGNALATPLP